MLYLQKNFFYRVYTVPAMYWSQKMSVKTSLKATLGDDTSNLL